MFDEFLDLPAHPLFVHLPIVLIPLLIALSVVYVVLPPGRRYVEWAVVGLAVVTPAITWATRESGYELKQRLTGNFGGTLPEELAADIDEHARLSYVLIWLVVALSLVILLFAVVSHRRRRDLFGDGDEFAGAGRGGAGGPLTVLAALVVIGLGAATGWYLFETGDLGARMVWEGQ